jgi:tripartite-type tricarboxylate transporter receptor subunit TctC
MLRRRSLAALAAAFAAPAAAAQDYPTRTIRLVVPRAPGGGSDNIARVLAAPLGARLGQTVVVENRPDATAILGAELVARAAPDGYTLYLADNSFYQNPSFIPHIPYDTIRDFAAVTMLAQAPVVLLANPAVPARTVAELVAYAKANPGKLSYASGGVGASTHFAGVLFNLRAGTEIVHVPFRSSGPAVTALLGNQVQLQFGGLSSARPYIEAGTLRALAVTSARRDPLLPDVPTFAESGLPGVDITSVWGIHAPARTPIAIRRALRDAIVATMQDPPVHRRLRELGYDPVGNTPEEHQRQTEQIVALWIDVAKRVNLNE